MNKSINKRIHIRLLLFLFCRLMLCHVALNRPTCINSDCFQTFFTPELFPGDQLVFY